MGEEIQIFCKHPMEQSKRRIQQKEVSATLFKVWLVDDNTQFTSILCESFKHFSTVCCTHIFDTGTHLLEYLETEPELPDVVLLDINMPGISGIETLAQLRLLAPQVRVLMLTVNVQDSNIQQALNLGAVGYLLKSSSIEEIVHGIETAMKGGMPLDPFVVPRVLALLSGETQKVSEVALTSREQEIVRLLTHGLSTQKIAEELFLSEHTVRTHIKKIFQKLDVHTRQQLVAKALREKII